jgi:hypothetical protein
MKHSMAAAYRILTGKHEIKRPVGRPRSKSEDNIKKDLKEVGIRKSGGWVYLARDRDQ